MSFSSTFLIKNIFFATPPFYLMKLWIKLCTFNGCRTLYALQ
uniref:Uncharacterized protein n=1 Tax=Meloidogyne enterolobii TaxID=390850 RepID=A0A6V7UT26_MELEN|nr:unnamed protein product [Meloidogyne enterolobii]